MHVQRAVQAVDVQCGPSCVPASFFTAHPHTSQKQMAVAVLFPRSHTHMHTHAHALTHAPSTTTPPTQPYTHALRSLLQAPRTASSGGRAPLRWRCWRPPHCCATPRPHRWWCAQQEVGGHSQLLAGRQRRGARLRAGQRPAHAAFPLSFTLPPVPDPAAFPSQGPRRAWEGHLHSRRACHRPRSGPLAGRGQALQVSRASGAWAGK